MARKTMNFDAFMQEKKQEPIYVTVYGKEYPVKPEIPAIVPIMMARSEQEISNEESVKLMFTAADALFGQAAVNEMCGKGMSSEQMALLIQKTFAAINGETPEDELMEEYTDDAGKTAKAKKPVKK